MTINARGDDDVEPDVILDKVAKASGGNFNFHKQTQEYRDAPRGPVVSRHTKYSINHIYRKHGGLVETLK